MAKLGEILRSIGKPGRPKKGSNSGSNDVLVPDDSPALPFVLIVVCLTA
jgi:hypothetical protein